MAINTKQEEGFSNKIYKDTKGIKTVGTGFNLEDKVTASLLPEEVVSGKRTITPKENEDAYNKRMALAIKDARTYLGKTYDNLSLEKQGAINDMSYNMGLPTLSKFQKVKEALDKKDYKTASKEILNSDYARKDVPKRARRNAEIIAKDDNEVALEKEVLRQALPAPDVSFDKAFANARQQGLKVFTWRGKEYTTKIK